MTKNTQRKAPTKAPTKAPAKAPEAQQSAPMDPTIREVKVGVTHVNRPRRAYALDTLIKEVESLFPETTYDVSGENGLNTSLDVTFSTKDCPGLADLLDLIENDPRVQSLLQVDDSTLVSFRSSLRTQDLRDPFQLDVAWTVLGDRFTFEYPSEVAPTQTESETSDDEDA